MTIAAGIDVGTGTVKIGGEDRIRTSAGRMADAAEHFPD